jgi:hypothetical protein
MPVVAVMNRCDVAPKHQNIIVIDTATICDAERLVEPCEHRNPVGNEIPFDGFSISSPVLIRPSQITFWSRPGSARTAGAKSFKKNLIEPT